MAQFLSVGDVLMLSQTAWKVGRAFTKGKKSAPAEFAQVESEANGLSEALKLVAEALHEDETLLSTAEPETMAAVNTILESAGRTLADLESFVDRYQVIKKRETTDGFTVEKMWSDVVIANYKTVKWTMEGGDIQALRNMLQMHSNSINLMMQALQTRSLSRLERTVMPMASNIAAIREQVSGDLGAKIDDVHRIIMSVVNSTPSLAPRRELEYQAGPSREGSITTPLLELATNDPWQQALLSTSPRTPDQETMALQRQSQTSRHDSTQPTPSLMSTPRKTERDALAADRISRPDSRSRLADFASSPYSMSTGNKEPLQIRRPSQTTKRESATLPVLIDRLKESNLEEEPNAATETSFRHDFAEDNGSPYTSGLSTSQLYRSSTANSVLPPPAVLLPEASPPVPATPLSIFSLPRRGTMTSDIEKRQSEPQVRPPSVSSQSSRPVQRSRNSNFERALFRNALILCDARGKLVEYAQQKPDEPDWRLNTEMRNLCEDCRVCVVRKRENREHGGTQAFTSIWVLSDDDIIRCQQKLPETFDTVPYCSYFDSEKVAIPPPEDGGEITLRFHGPRWSDQAERETKTNWINYVFDADADATAFQSAIYGRRLLASFHTTKTTVIHDGIKGAFAFEEQFANIEMLRLWEVDGVADPAAQGGVLALMHMSSNFGTGWARWWMNGTQPSTRVKDDGGRWAKVKGIDVTVVQPGEPGRKAPMKKVSGVKIEFKTEEEKREFLALVQMIQRKLIALPPP